MGIKCKGYAKAGKAEEPLFAAYDAVKCLFHPKPANDNHEKELYFRDGLRVAGSFGRAKKFGNPDFAKEAASRFEKLQEKFRNDDGAFAYATGLWMNLEAYQATGKGRYARQAGRDADALAVLDVAKPPETDEDKLMAASALLKYYSLSKDGTYKRKAEELLGNIGLDKPTGFQKKLACMAYSDADKIVGGFENEKKLFESEAASIERDKLGTYLHVAQKAAGRLYPIAKKMVYGAGGVADKASEYLEDNGWGKTGKAVKFLFGTETLKRTSFGVGGGGVLAIPGFPAVGNFCGRFTWWTGDVNYFEQNGGEISDYHRIVYRELNTPWVGGSQTTIGPMLNVSAIPYTTFRVNRRMTMTSLGLWGLLAVGFGRVDAIGPGQYARGPFITFNKGFGLYTLSLTTYSPALEPLVGRLNLGAAWLKSKNDAILEHVKARVKKRRDKTAVDASPSYTAKEIYGTFPFTQGHG